MTREILRDKALDWIERLFAGPYLDGFCWAMIVIAALYFSPALIQLLARS